MELVIFRIVQESLTNMIRHSGSKTASIRVAARGRKQYRRESEDQGKGMSAERLTEIQSQGTGVGIRGMRERVRHFRGDLVIESNGSGTKVYATLPLKTSLSTHTEQHATRQRMMRSPTLSKSTPASRRKGIGRTKKTESPIAAIEGRFVPIVELRKEQDSGSRATGSGWA